MKRLWWLAVGSAMLLSGWLCIVMPTGTPEAAAAIYAPELLIGNGTVGQVDTCRVQYMPDGANWSSVQNGTILYQNDPIQYASYMMQRLSDTSGNPTNFYATVLYPSSRPASYTPPSGVGYEGLTMKGITETYSDGSQRSVAAWVVTYKTGSVYVSRNGSDVALSVGSRVYPGELVKFPRNSVVRLHAQDASGNEMDHGLLHVLNVAWGGDPPPPKPRCAQYVNPYGQPR